MREKIVASIIVWSVEILFFVAMGIAAYLHWEEFLTAVCEIVPIVLIVSLGVIVFSLILWAFMVHYSEDK